MKNININSNKNLAMLDDIQIKHLMECFNMYRVSYRDIYISNNRKLESISDIYINKNSVFNFNILNDSIINKIKSVNVFNPRIIDIYNNVILKNLLRNNEYDNNKSFERYLSRVNIRYINKHAPSLYAYRYNLKDLYVGADLKELDQIMRHDIMRGDSKLFEKYSVQDIYINNLELKALYLNKRKYMYYENKYKYFSGLSTKFMDKYKNKFVIPYGNAQIYKFDFYMLRKIGTWNAFKYISYYVSKAGALSLYKMKQYMLSKDGALSIYKEFQNLLQKTELPIFKYKEHYLSKSYWYDIFKQHEYMFGKSNEYIFKSHYDEKSLEVTKRWWWLNPTDSRDSLIIPNVDFIYDSYLLNNKDFEYLRFTNHPIGWGTSWGMDFNIPSYAVSIEIMLDLVNILIMIWHDNVQGWLCCTGKEGIQFVMELLYDWYTLDTSKPNTDYYRAYRWIRWEAEKAYFLNLDNGLQAIGVLISNLIDYLKNHHFDIVPLWRNPKAMDIERNFNRLAQNGDLMKISDKTKGKRYYYIENKNENKKNILGDDV